MSRATLFLAICSLSVLAVHGGADFKCLMTKCGTQVMSCGFDKNCFMGYMCMGSCVSDMDCILKCFATYYSDALNKLVDCSISRHECLTPLDPHPTVCRKPSDNSLAEDFSLKLLTGKFYNVYGLNRLYECRDYSHKHFTLKDNSTLSMTEWYDLPMMDGNPRTFEDKQEFTVSDANTPNIMTVSTVGEGILRNDEYRVLSFSENYVFVYYCGKACGLGYEGAVVFSRTPELSNEDTKAVEAEAAQRGWKLSDFCQPKQKAVMK